MKSGTSEFEQIFPLRPRLIFISISHSKFNNVPYIGYYKLLKPAIVARDAELVKNVMIKDFSSFQENDHKLSKRSDPLLGQNPFFLDGDEWQAERKLITPSLSPAKVRFYRNYFVNGTHLSPTIFYFQQIKSSYPTMQGTCDKLIKYLRTLSAKKDVELGDVRTIRNHVITNIQTVIPYIFGK